MREYLTEQRLDTDGIEAYAENGRIHEYDNCSAYTFPDTPENRKMVIAHVMQTIEIEKMEI